MSEPTESRRVDGNRLCLACGLCCDGVIFGDVKLEPGDDPAKLRSLGLPVSPPKTRRPRGSACCALGFGQPCAALKGLRCTVYHERPIHCRKFECALFKKVMAGGTTAATALKVIRSAHLRADRVRRLLRALGDTCEDLPLRDRFRQTEQRVWSEGLSQQSSATYSRLTLAVHDLNLLLSEAFYPGS